MGHKWAAGAVDDDRVMTKHKETNSRPRLFDLSGVPLFAGLGSEELDAVLSRSTPVRLPPGRTLGREGRAGFDCVLICTGTVKVSRHGEAIIEIGTGSVFGEMALLGETPHQRNADGVTTSTCDVLVFTRSEFADLLRRHPIVEERLHAMIATRQSNSHATR